MVVLKYLLPALAAANAAFAADCGSGDTLKISSQSDADSYGSCKKLDGDVKISGQVGDSIVLNGIKEISGSLIAKNSSTLSELSAPNLQSIGDKFELDTLEALTTLSMGSLTSVGSIKWSVMSRLQSLDFGKKVAKADNVEITNTGLTNLDGISLDKIGRLDITENRYLKHVNFDGLKKATDLINFAGNLNSLEVKLPNLLTGSNMTFRNVSGVEVPSLANLTGQLGFWADGFEKFSAPNLTESSDLTFIGNKEARNISMPKLEKVNGGFQIARNDNLTEISFPSLAMVTGALDFSGNFDKVELPSLDTVRGGFNMQSTGNFSCDNFQSLRKNKVIHGEYKCKGNTPNPTTKDGKSGSSSTKSGSDSSETSEGAAADNVANMGAMGMAALFGALLQYAM